jgi:hypothetical protein
MDCFAALAMTDTPEIVVRVNTSVFAFFSFGTKRIFAMTDAVVIDANNLAQAFMDCFAALAMTDAVVFADANATSLAHRFQFSIRFLSSPVIFNFQFKKESV